MCSLLILSLLRRRHAYILFYIVIFYEKVLAIYPKCVYNKSHTGSFPWLSILPFLLNFVTILLRILLNFCNYFVIRRRTAYEHAV